MPMLTRGIHLALAVLASAVISAAAASESEPAEYKPGDVAAEDIVTPVTIRVVDPELTAVLKQRNAAQVPLIFRQIETAAGEAETDLRSSVDAARATFMAVLRQELAGRAPTALAADFPAYAHAARAATATGSGSIPVALFAPLWIRGASDAAIVDALLQPVRELMAQPIVNDNEWGSLALDQPVRLIRVKSLLEEPSLSSLETAGENTTAARLSGLESARGVVGSYFSEDQKVMAQFAAGFIRANTFPAPGLTELLRAKGRDGAIAYDTYAAGQVIAKKGQAVDGKVLAALAAVRDKRIMEALLTKVESKPSVASPIITDTKRFVTGVGATGLVLLLILWRWGGPQFRTKAVDSVQAVSGPLALPYGTDAEDWRTRALIAEQRAERAHEAIRQGALGWMRERLFRSIFRQRADLLSTQQMAEAEMVELEQRMAQLVVPLQERIRTYENRIRELEEMLAVEEADDRQLIDARINRTRRLLELERARVGRDF